MRTFDRTIVALMFGTALIAAPAFGFDGAPVNKEAPVTAPLTAAPTAKKPIVAAPAPWYG